MSSYIFNVIACMDFLFRYLRMWIFVLCSPFNLIQFNSIHILSVNIWKQFLKQMIFIFFMFILSAHTIAAHTIAHFISNGFHSNWIRINFNCSDEWLNNYNYHYFHLVNVFIGFHLYWMFKNFRSLFWSPKKCWSLK